MTQHQSMVERAEAAPSPDVSRLRAAAYTMLQFARDPNLAGCTTGFGFFMWREAAIELVQEIINEHGPGRGQLTPENGLVRGEGA